MFFNNLHPLPSEKNAEKKKNSFASLKIYCVRSINI